MGVTGWTQIIIVSETGLYEGTFPSACCVLDQLIIDNGKGVEGIDGEGARKREGISGGGKSLDKISLIAIIQE